MLQPGSDRRSTRFFLHVHLRCLPWCFGGKRSSRPFFPLSILSIEFVSNSFTKYFIALTHGTRTNPRSSKGTEILTQAWVRRYDFEVNRLNHNVSCLVVELPQIFHLAWNQHRPPLIWWVSCFCPAILTHFGPVQMDTNYVPAEVSNTEDIGMLTGCSTVWIARIPLSPSCLSLRGVPCFFERKRDGAQLLVGRRGGGDITLKSVTYSAFFFSADWTATLHYTTFQRNCLYAHGQTL